MYLLKKISCGLLLVGLVATGCAAKAEKDLYFVRNVVDGDTVELANGEKVRYIGINTPETMKRVGGQWLYAPEPYGTEAKELNRAIVSRKNVRLRFDKERKDRYGRTLAYVYTEDGTMANARLVEEGYATVYTFPPNVRYYEELLKAQEQAREQKKGIWGTIKTISADDASGHSGSFAIIRGVVSGVDFSYGRLVLYVTGPKGLGIRALIYTRNIELFERQGIDPSSFYTGKTVEVAGKIVLKDGPEVLIDNPSQIKPL